MIGVFDSGIGGLTVMRELLRELPECGFVYLGDTARTPYGTKGPDTIRRYAREDAQFLIDRGARVVVVACNTASALAADDLRSAFPKIPVIEVVTPAVEEAIRVTRTGRIGVIGTRATIASGVYECMISQRLQSCHCEEQRDEAISASAALRLPPATLRSRLKATSLAMTTHSEVFAQPCPLLVPLVEEGWLDHPETASIVRTYLEPLRAAGVDTLILGCTHYPLLEPIIRKEITSWDRDLRAQRATSAREEGLRPTLREERASDLSGGKGVLRETGRFPAAIVNPARAVAGVVRERLQRDPVLARACRGTSRAFHFTDTTPHTERIASEWLGMAVDLEKAEIAVVQ